jgi:4-diphosphocytidyl-2-C-methyl-D-erythritol kinase
MATRVRSFAKINLGLAIGGLRPDGFHALATVYQTIGLHDFVTVSARAAGQTSIAVTSTHAKVPLDARNTAWRMVESALDAMKISARVSIHIEKLLPVQGGLGAGSANAVAALLGLERELGKQLLPAERLRVAADVGSDVPLFLIGGTVLGLGRGEQVIPLPDLPATYCVIATPEVGVSTPAAFREWDARHNGLSGAPFGLSLVPARGAGLAEGTLTQAGPSVTLERLSRAVAGVWSGPYSSGVSKPETGLKGDLAGNTLLALVRTGIENDFEEVVFPQHPLLGEIKQLLATSVHPDEKAIYASLSGSGAALFGLYGSEGAAIAAQQRLSLTGVPGLVTETISRDRYWDTTFVD